jgi:hypothetical protein
MHTNIAGTRNNGEELTLARRNKYLMGEQVRSSGTRAVQQKMATSWADVEGFFKDWQPDPFKASVTRTPFTTRYTQLQQCCAFREYRAVLSYSIAAISSHIAVVSSLCQFNQSHSLAKLGAAACVTVLLSACAATASGCKLCVLLEQCKHGLSRHLHSQTHQALFLLMRALELC